MDDKMVAYLRIAAHDELREKVRKLISLVLEAGRVFTEFEFSDPEDSFDELEFNEAALDKLCEEHPLFDQLCFYNKEKDLELIIRLFPSNGGSIRIVEHGVSPSLYNEVFDAVSAIGLQIMVAYRQADIEDKLQNQDSLLMWKYFNVPMPDYLTIIPAPHKTINEHDKEVISIESLPGHRHEMNFNHLEGLSFVSCWQMYFAPVYYKYMPKPLFDAFNQCEENIVLENGLRRITLYSNPMDFEKPENRSRQWAFRRQLGIDSIAHELTKQVNRVEPADLPVEITRKQATTGAVRVTRYVDAEGRTVPPSVAVAKEIREYDDAGTVIVFEKAAGID